MPIEEFDAMLWMSMVKKGDGGGGRLNAVYLANEMEVII